MGDPEPVTPKGRNRHPSGGSTSGANPKVLSDRFSTFSPAKGIKRSESDSDIQKRRSGIPVPTKPSGIPVSKSRSGSIGRSPSGDLTPMRSAFSRSASLRGSKGSSPGRPKIVVTDDDDETFWRKLFWERLKKSNVWQEFTHECITWHIGMYYRDSRTNCIMCIHRLIKLSLTMRLFRPETTILGYIYNY